MKPKLNISLEMSVSTSSVTERHEPGLFIVVLNIPPVLCCSGHGLSGVGLLTWLSFMAVPAMFGGGIGTAFLMKYTGTLCQWSYVEGQTITGNNTFIC